MEFSMSWGLLLGMVMNKNVSPAILVMFVSHSIILAVFGMTYPLVVFP